MQVIVKLTNQCNLRCRYCSEGDSETNHYLSEEIWQKLVDELPELMAFKNAYGGRKRRKTTIRINEKGE